jgi:hypothetical protein
MNARASPAAIPSDRESPNAVCPYMIPKLTALAALRCAGVTASSETPFTSAAAAR